MTNKQIFLNNCIVLDTETTSKSYKEAEVVELGYLIEGTGFTELYKPYALMEPEVMAIHHISNRMVEDKPHFEDCVSEFTDIVEAFNGDAILVAHNSFYDMKVLQNYGVNHDTWLCTMRLAKKIFGSDDSVNAFNLGYLRYRFEIMDPADQETISAHRALDDAKVTAELLELLITAMEIKGLIEEDQPYHDQVMAFLDAPAITEIMPFGKHKGKKMVDVPMDYWKWALDNMDTLDEKAENYDKDFAASVNLALEKLLDA